MKKIAFSIVAAFTLTLGSAVAFAGDMSSQSMDGMNGMSGSSPPSYSTGSSGGQMSDGSQMTRNVIIQNFAFMPASISVQQGTTVTWTNRDTTAHTVTGDTSTGPMSGTLQPGQAYSFTFSQQGTFNYHCSIHPTMTGTVTVTAPPSSGGSGGGSTQTPPSTTPTTPSQPSENNNTNNMPTPPSQGGNSSNSSSSANSNSTSTATVNVTQTPAQSEESNSSTTTSNTTTPTTTTPTTPVTTTAATTPVASSAPATLPNTGAADVLAAFVGATAIGMGTYYLYAHRKMHKSAAKLNN